MYADKANILNNYFLLYCFTKEIMLVCPGDSHPIVDSLYVTADAYDIFNTGFKCSQFLWTR